MKHKIDLENRDGVGDNLLIRTTIEYIKNQIDSQNYSHKLLCIDDLSRSFRRDIYHSYKADRFKANPITAKMPNFIKSINGMGVMTHTESGFDASDIIASVMTQVAKIENVKTTIITNDKRIYPHLHKGMTIKSAAIFDGKNARGVTSSSVVSEFGNVSRAQLVGVLSMIGDQKKGIPGLSGLGPKKSLAIIKRHTNFIDLLSNNEEIERLALQSKNPHAYEDLKISYGLTALNSKIPIKITPSEIITKP